MRPFRQTGIPMSSPMETPFFTGRAVAALAGDPSVFKKTGQVHGRNDLGAGLQRCRL